jgi:hypothetical protein
MASIRFKTDLLSEQELAPKSQRALIVNVLASLTSKYGRESMNLTLASLDLAE